MKGVFHCLRSDGKFLTRARLWPTILALGLVVGGGVVSAVSVRAQENPRGLRFRVERDGQADESVRPNVQLHVARGEPPAPFVDAGRFTATWEGFVRSELRSVYAFHVALNGEVEIEINGRPFWSGSGSDDSVRDAGSIRLAKGDNALKVRYVAPAEGDAFLRLLWSGRDTPRNPIPYDALSHEPTPSLREFAALHEGREILLENRCVACHGVDVTSPIPELSMDAPAFNGIGSRRRADWLAEWVLNPHAIDDDAPMPVMFRGDSARTQARAVAAFLASLKDGEGEGRSPVEGDPIQGRALYETLHCVACHVDPASPAGSKETDGGHGEGHDSKPGGHSQDWVRAKFTPGSLATFLMAPERHFHWTEMPNFGLNLEEASHLAAYLESVAGKTVPGWDLEAPEADRVRIGRDLVATVGCLNCHVLDGLENRSKAPSLSGLRLAGWDSGCVADEPPTRPTSMGTPMPWYPMEPGKRALLKNFLEKDQNRASLGRHVAADFVQRHSGHLNCRGCHGAYQEEFPGYDILGGKLKPEWAAAFIGGQVSWKPRPWLEMRMPAFPAYAQALGEGLATLHGWPARTPTEPDPVAGDVENGRRLMSAEGFSCVSCHSVADFGATQVFEAPGINLAHSFERLQRDYYFRWLLSPISVDSTTKMPGFFDDQGNSPLREYYNGDGPRTIWAMWETMKLGKSMPPPGS